MASPSSDSASNDTPEFLLAEAREQLRQLEAALPESLDGYILSPKSKLPFLHTQTGQERRWPVSCSHQKAEGNLVAVTRKPGPRHHPTGYLAA